MSIINGYKITSSHGTGGGKYPASARVRDPAGVLVALVVANRGDVLQWIRQRPASTERYDFVAQLESNGVPDTIIKQILAVPARDVNLSVVHRAKDI